MGWLKLKNEAVNLDRVELIRAVRGESGKIAGFAIHFSGSEMPLVVKNAEDVETVARVIDFQLAAARPSEEQIAVGMIAGMLVGSFQGEIKDFEAVSDARRIMDAVYNTEEGD